MQFCNGLVHHQTATSSCLRSAAWYADGREANIDGACPVDLGLVESNLRIAHDPIGDERSARNRRCVSPTHPQSPTPYTKSVSRAWSDPARKITYRGSPALLDRTRTLAVYSKQDLDERNEFARDQDALVSGKAP